MKQLAVAVLLCAISASALAQKKPPPPAANPEIAYVDTRSKFPEIKLAFEDLTGSFVVYRSIRQGAMPRFDLSPRGQNQIAVTSGGFAELISWSSNGSVVTVSKQPLGSASGAEGATFSPDGARIAIFYHGESKLRIFEAATRQVVAEWPVPFIFHMTYTGDGSKVAFINYPQNAIFEIDVATGAISSTNFPLGKPNFLGGGRGSNALLVTYRADEAVPESLYLASWENGAVVADRFVQGWDAQYNCNETRIVYRATGPAPDTRIYSVVSGATNLLTRNTDIRRVDYMPTC